MTHHHYRDEMDFRDLLRHPWKLLGYAYGYYFTIVVGLGLIYVFNLSDIGKNTVPARVLTDSTAFVKDIPTLAAAVIPPVDVKVAGRPNDSLIALGRSVFKANCASCHGDEGMGDGPGGDALNPKPRNFHVFEGWTNGVKVSQIYRTLEEGLVRNGMAAYDYLPAKDRFGLAHLIRSWVPNAPGDTDADLQGLETAYQLSKGKVRTPQVSVSKAMTLILKEQQPEWEAMTSSVAALEKSDDRGAVILRSVSSDSRRVVASLTSGGYRFASVDALVKAVCADPARLGFKASATRLSSEDWSAVHGYLTKSAPKRNS